MKNWKINSIEFSSFISYIIISTLIGIGVNNITEISGTDAYLSIILSYFLGFFILIIFLYLFKQEQSITDLTKYIFGKFIGTIINYLLLIPVIILSICVLYSISNFLVSQFLSNTPILIMYITSGITLYYAQSKGIVAISRSNILLLSLTILLFIMIVIGLSPQIKLDNFLPFMKEGISRPVKGALMSIISNITPILILLTISKKNIINTEKTTKHIIIFYTLGMILAFINIAFAVGVLGIHLTDIYQYPEYMVLKRISVFGFLNRLENFFSVHWIFRAFSLLSITIYYTKNTIKKDSDSKILTLSIILLFIVLNLIIFKNNTKFNTFAIKVYPYSNLFFLIMIIIICIGTFIKNKKTLKVKTSKV